jgi:hypothetical protein
VRTVHSNNEVSFDDKIPLQRWLKVSDIGGSVASRPSVAMLPVMMLGKTDGGSVAAYLVVVESATTEKEVAVDETVAKGVADDVATTEVRKAADDAVATMKVTYDTTVAKRVADDVAAAKRAADDTVTAKKAADDEVVAKRVADDVAVAERDVVGEVATDAATREKAASDATVKEGTTAEVASQDVAEYSPTPVAGAKRAIAIGSSTPPARHQFPGSWKPRYAVVACNFSVFFFLILFYLDPPLCSASPTSKTSTPGADQAHSGAAGHSPQVS